MIDVVVDDDHCAGHAVCVSLAPEVFGLSDDGFAIVLLREVPDSLADSVRQAERQCPTNAISVRDRGDDSTSGPNT